MPWQEIPETIENVLNYLPNPFNFKIKSQDGKLYYWVKEQQLTKHPVSSTCQDEFDDYLLE